MRAIVTGVTGQDGFYMARRLLAEGMEVIGMTSNIDEAARHFPADGSLRLIQFDYSIPGAFGQVMDATEPDLIFNFAAKASGEGMFDAPGDMARLNADFVVDVLEAIRKSGRRDMISFCQASSSEMYGDVAEAPQTEQTPFRPRSPYGASKLFGHNMISIYRDHYGVRCSSAILYNHESTRRSTRFVTMKVANAAARIALGLSDHLVLGSLDAQRDWGYAPEYVEAMFKMSVAETPDDYVVATGRLTSVRHLCDTAFGHVGLKYTDLVRVPERASRPAESCNLLGDPGKIRTSLGWSARRTIEETIVEMVEYELERLRPQG